MSAISVEVLLLEGSPFGLRHATIDNGNVRAFAAPRVGFQTLLSRPEMTRAGVYVLHSGDAPTSSGLPEAYIGETEALAGRLPEHDSKDFAAVPSPQQASAPAAPPTGHASPLLIGQPQRRI